MRITPNHPRLRLIALLCWIVGSWWLMQIVLFDAWYPTPFLPVAILVSGAIFLAVGIAFWELSLDKRAGIVLDRKGLMLNLGHSASFVAWDNVAEVGLCRRRDSLLALGSRYQLGIRLYDPAAYIQSYEQRLPSASGPLAFLLQTLYEAFRPLRQLDDGLPKIDHLRRTRARTGYDVVIPEALLGGRAEAFITMIEGYCYDPQQRHILGKYV